MEHGGSHSVVTFTLMMQTNCACSSLCIYIYISSLLCTISVLDLSASITVVELDLFSYITSICSQMGALAAMFFKNQKHSAAHLESRLALAKASTEQRFQISASSNTFFTFKKMRHLLSVLELLLKLESKAVLGLQKYKGIATLIEMLCEKFRDCFTNVLQILQLFERLQFCCTEIWIAECAGICTELWCSQCLYH